mmetsp:Transcript_4401/g.7749  ORF Transcript_4401/g.7749 Transcript_4401/m.7749 type:complete len:257 (+) Transcript_4401:1244-2014(+)
MRGEVLRGTKDHLADLLENIFIHAGWLALRKLADRVLTLPLGIHPFVLKILRSQGRIRGFGELLFVGLHYKVLNLSNMSVVAQALFYALFRVFVQHIRSTLDNIVHMRLGERRLVHFVVPVTAVSYNVNNDIAKISLTVLCSNFEYVGYSFRIVSVNMEDGTLKCTSKICAVQRGAAHVGISSEANLVVHNHVNAPACFILRQGTHVHCFINDTLSTESSISVNQDRHRLRSIGIIVVVLLCASLTDHHGVYGLQV